MKVPMSAFVFLLLSLGGALSHTAEASTAWSHSERQMVFDPSQSGGEQFEKNLGRVPYFLEEGQTFDKDLLQEYYSHLQKQIKISEVPPWFYGTWKSEKQVQDFTYIYGSGRVAEDIELQIDTYDTIGDVKAADQKIYSIVSLGSLDSIVRGSNLIEYQVSLSDERLASFGKYIWRDTSLRLQINPTNNRIVKVFQVQSEKIYHPSFDGSTMLTEGWLKSFTQEGEPFILSHTKSFKNLVEKHKLIDLDKLDFDDTYTGIGH